MHSSMRQRLKTLLGTGKTLVALGATDALSAKLIESHGFECVYIGSYATAASRFGLPDTGALSLPEMADQARTIVDAVSVPVIADAEGGFHDSRRALRRSTSRTTPSASTPPWRRSCAPRTRPRRASARRWRRARIRTS
ncbi:MAG: hypothetical protein E6H57_06215 [Betaproteobacteria bacterium]|nr:MAG: hypothetical protein E6H57_06215 [Betaproteobacteria bacterium]